MATLNLLFVRDGSDRRYLLTKVSLAVLLQCGGFSGNVFAS